MSLNEEDREYLLLALAEARARGLKVKLPQKDGVRADWSLGANRYFVRNDGKLYSPLENQGNFIRSRSRFCGFVGGRGSGKTAAGMQKALFKIMKGESGAIMNPDFEQFRTSTWPEARTLPNSKRKEACRLMIL